MEMMKIALASLLLTLSAFAADGTATVSDVKGIMETWRQALAKGDAATLDKLYSKDLTYTHSSGKTETKAESIKNASNPETMSKAVEFLDLEVLTVWIKSGSSWQLVARQATTVQ